MKRSTIALLLIVLVLIIDQTLKFWVKTNMALYEENRIMGEFFKLHFTENNGMAFGMELGGEIGKLILSLFRIIAVSGIGYWLWTLSRKSDSPRALLFGVALIFAGALGNIIDSVFYGLVFSESTSVTIAQFMPDSGGYERILHGKVVDMLHFHLFDYTWGGKKYEFFQPIFNVADSSITIGVVFFLIGNWIMLRQEARQKEAAKVTA